MTAALRCTTVQLRGFGRVGVRTRSVATSICALAKCRSLEIVSQPSRSWTSLLRFTPEDYEAKAEKRMISAVAAAVSAPKSFLKQAARLPLQFGRAACASARSVPQHSRATVRRWLRAFPENDARQKSWLRPPQIVAMPPAFLGVKDYRGRGFSPRRAQLIYRQPRAPRGMPSPFSRGARLDRSREDSGRRPRVPFARG